MLATMFEKANKQTHFRLYRWVSCGVPIFI